MLAENGREPVAGVGDPVLPDTGGDGSQVVSFACLLLLGRSHPVALPVVHLVILTLAK